MKGFMEVGEENKENVPDDAAIAQQTASPRNKKKTTGSHETNTGAALSNGVVGSVLSDRYEIKELLGKGGMADVYLARDKKTKTDVAIKILKEELTNDEEFIQRFDTEAKAASSLSYPNIVKVFDVGQEGKLRFMVLEYINGISLKELIQKNGHLEPEVAVPIAIQIGLALDNAHKNGIIHRDIKPHNIIVTPELIAKVTDFGIARAASANTVTLTGRNAMGSVHYFSPEQARGGIVGEQSDIYSLGILIYEMLTGVVPFDGDTSVSIALKHIQTAPRPPKDISPDVPDGLNNIIMKCIQKSPEQRYKKVRDLVDELDAFMIDPDGVYGFVDITVDRSKTSVIKPMERDPNFNKLREMELLIKKKNRLKIRERILVFLAIVLTIALLGGAGYYAFEWIKTQLSTPSVDYRVENYVGSTIENVKSKLDAAKIAYDVIYEQNETVDPGIVFYQSVAEDLTMRPGGASKITLKVSSGKDTVRLGDYKGKNYNIVESEIIQILALKVKIIRQLSGDVPKDYVIDTSPSAGNDVPKGGEVTLIVSDGLLNVKVPEVIGKTRAEALAMLKTSFLDKIVHENLLGSDPKLPEDKWYVLGIEPAVGTEVKALTPVNLLFGSYQDYLDTKLPKVTPTPTTAPTVPPTPAVSSPSASVP